MDFETEIKIMHIQIKTHFSMMNNYLLLIKDLIKNIIIILYVYFKIALSVF